MSVRSNEQKHHMALLTVKHWVRNMHTHKCHRPNDLYREKKALKSNWFGYQLPCRMSIELPEVGMIMTFKRCLGRYMDKTCCGGYGPRFQPLTPAAHLALAQVPIVHCICLPVPLPLPLIAHSI